MDSKPLRGLVPMAHVASVARSIEFSRGIALVRRRSVLPRARA